MSQATNRKGWHHANPKTVSEYFLDGTIRGIVAAEVNQLRRDMDGKMDRILAALDDIKKDVGGLKTEVTGLKTEVAGIRKDVAVLTDRVSEVEKKVEKAEQAGKEWFKWGVLAFITITGVMNTGLVAFVNQRLPPQQSQPIVIQQPAPVPTIPPAVMQGEKNPADQ